MFNHPAREDPVRTLRVSRGLLLWVEELTHTGAAEDLSTYIS